MSVAVGIAEIVVLQSPEIVGRSKASGIGFILSPTSTSIIMELSQPPVPVMVQEYWPEFIVVALEIVGFCWVDVKPFGPVQL